MEKYKQNRISLLVLLASVVLLPALAIFVLWGIDRCSEEIERTRNERDRAQFNRALYASFMGFDFRVMKDGEQLSDSKEVRIWHFISDQLNPRDRYFDSFYTDVVLTYTEEEALTYPDDVITAWPTAQTLRRINAINWFIQREGSEFLSAGKVDLSEYSLEYPITLTDAIDNWEEVFTLYIDLTDEFTSRFELTLAYFSGTAYRGLMENPKFFAELEQLTREKYSAGVAESVVSACEIYFALDFGFDFRMIVGDRVVDSPAQVLLRTQALYPEFFDPFYIEFVLAESEEEAMQLPDDVVAAWPTQETQKRLNALNWIIQREGVNDSEFGLTGNIDPSEFSLEYPIITSDLFEDKDKVNSLFYALAPSIRSSIVWSLSDIRREANSPEFLAELESLKEQRNTEVSE